MTVISCVSLSDKPTDNYTPDPAVPVSSMELYTLLQCLSACCFGPQFYFLVHSHRSRQPCFQTQQVTVNSVTHCTLPALHQMG